MREIHATVGSWRGQYRVSITAYSSDRYLGPRPKAPTNLDRVGEKEGWTGDVADRLTAMLIPSHCHDYPLFVPSLVTIKGWGGMEYRR